MPGTVCQILQARLTKQFHPARLCFVLVLSTEIMLGTISSDIKLFCFPPVKNDAKFVKSGRGNLSETIGHIYQKTGQTHLYHLYLRSTHCITSGMANMP